MMASQSKGELNYPETPCELVYNYVTSATWKVIFSAQSTVLLGAFFQGTIRETCLPTVISPLVFALKFCSLIGHIFVTLV